MSVPVIHLCPGEEDLAWAHFVLHAARGSFAAPGWATSALLRSVSDTVGVPVENIDDEQMDRAIESLPKDPTVFLAELATLAGIAMPELLERPHLSDAAVQGLQRTPVDGTELLRDSMLQLLNAYSGDGLETALAGIAEPRAYDARSAVVVMLYALLLARGDVD
jgi:hypothetical protein